MVGWVAPRLLLPLVIVAALAPSGAAESDGMATLHGVLRDTNGEVRPGAELAIVVQYDCASMTCTLRDEEHRVDLNTAADGSWTATVPAGGLEVIAFPAYESRTEQYGYTSERFTLRSGETREVSLVVARYPAASATLRGVILDAEDGVPIDGGWLSVWSQTWGTFAPGSTTAADPNGIFEAAVLPGRSVVHVRVEAFKDEPCALSADDEGGDDGDAAVGVIRICRRPTNDYTYHGQSIHITSEPQGVTELEIRLERRDGSRPPRIHDAELVGWVVDRATQQGIPDAIVSAYNEATYEWGTTRTDADGAYRLALAGGPLLVHVQALEHFWLWQNAMVPTQKVTHLDLHMDPGFESGGLCCWAPPAENYDIPLEGPAPPPPRRGLEAAEPDDHSLHMPHHDFGAAGWHDWVQSFEGMNAGLGPYDPQARLGSAGIVDSPTAPAASILLAALLGTLLLARRRDQTSICRL